MRLLLFFLCLLTSSLYAKMTISSNNIENLTKEEGFNLLTENNYHPSKITNAGDTFIHTAVKKNDLLAIKIGVLCGVDIQMPNSVGDTPLHLAAEKGHLEIVEYLLDQDVAFNWINLLGQAPYHKALRNQHTQVLNILIEKGYCPKDETTDYLIAFGYNASIKDNQGNTVVHKAVLENNLTVLEMLIHSGWSVDTLNKSEKTPLMLAIMKGNTEIFFLLIELGADINHRDAQGNTPLMLATAKKNYFLINQLIQNPAIQLNTLNHKGIGALHLAVAQGDIYAVQAMLSQGANVNLSTAPEYWSEMWFWTSDDYSAYGEFATTADRINQGYLAPKVTPLGIAQAMHVQNVSLIELLESYDAIKEHTHAISKNDNPPISLEQYLKI